jgi:hypothetical protein
LARLLSTALVLALLAGTTVAFGVTEALKLEKTPITRPEIDKQFSPLSESGAGTADVDFTLRKGDRIDVGIVDADGELVRTIVAGVRRSRGFAHFTWDGRDDAGRLVPEGRYRPRVHLDHEHRTIVIPNTIEVDTTAPELAFLRARPRAFSPDRDGRREYVRIRFRFDEPTRPLLLVDGRQEGKGRFVRRGGRLNWFGKRPDGRPLPPGVYTLSLRGEDRAGNISPVSRPVRVRIRYVELARDVVRAQPGSRFRIRVVTDAKRVRWRIAGKGGRTRRRTLVLPAPRQPGRYTLFVTASGHGAKAAVVVAAK